MKKGPSKPLGCASSRVYNQRTDERKMSGRSLSVTCSFVRPIRPALVKKAGKGVENVHSRPCMVLGRFGRRDLLKYLPVFVAVCPSIVNSQTANSEVHGEQESSNADIDPGVSEPEITDRAYLDISIDNRPSQRIIVGLYGTVVPKTVANFVSLCENGYANTKIYRIVPGLTVQLGDVLNNNGKSGRAATDSGLLDAETFRIAHTIPGIVSMVTKNGKVDSRFFVATRKGDSKYLDGKYVAFGRVVEGMEFFNEIEREGEGLLRRPVRVVASGIMP